MPVHAGKLEQVTNFTIVGGAAEHCVDRHMVLFRYCSLGGDTVMLGGLHARLCHVFLALNILPSVNDSTQLNRNFRTQVLNT